MKTWITFLIVTLLTACTAKQAPDPLDFPFPAADLATLPAHERLIIQQAGEDFQAVLHRRLPTHAKPDQHSPAPSDGSSQWQGTGYRLVIVNRLIRLGSLHAVLYGPEITFARPFAPGNTDTISALRLYPQGQKLLPSGQDGVLVGIDITSLPEPDQTILREASEDFAAVLAGERPHHARHDDASPVMADGGTSYFLGNGYELTVSYSLSSFGRFNGVAYGPILTFNQKFAGSNQQSIADIRIQTLEEANSRRRW